MLEASYVFVICAALLVLVDLIFRNYRRLQHMKRDQRAAERNIRAPEAIRDWTSQTHARTNASADNPLSDV